MGTDQLVTMCDRADGFSGRREWAVASNDQRVVDWSTQGPGEGAGQELADATDEPEAVEQARRVREGQIAQVQAQNLVVQEGERRVGFFQTGQSILLGLGHVLQ